MKKRVVTFFRNDTVRVIGGYLLLTLVMTYPLIIRFTTHIPGGGDEWNYINLRWWFFTSFFELNASPWVSDYLLYPDGFAVSGSIDNILNTIVLAPLLFIFSSGVLHNIIVILSFVAACLTMYFLALYLFKEKRAAFISGLTFGLSAYMLVRATVGHINLLSTWAIPLYLLFLIKTHREKRKKNAMLGGLALALTVGSSLYYGLFAAFISVFYVLYYLIAEKIYRSVDTIKRFIKLALWGAVFSIPVAFPVLVSMFQGEAVPYSIEHAVVYSADILSYLFPHPSQPLLGSGVSEWFSQFSGNTHEQTTFFGYGTAVLALVFLIKVKHRLKPFLLWMAGVFFVLSLGPFLRVAGKLEYALEEGVTKIPLPFKLLYDTMPITHFIRAPNRFSILVVLAIALMVAGGSAWILHSMKNKATLVFGLLIVISLADKIFIPYPLVPVVVHPFYEQLAEDTETYAILPLPPNMGTPESAEYAHDQTVHGKKIVGGYVNFTAMTPETTAFLSSTPFLNQSACHGHAFVTSPEFSTVPSFEEVQSILSENNVRYMIVHKETLEQEVCVHTKRLYDRFFPKNAFFEDDEIAVYSTI